MFGAGEFRNRLLWIISTTVQRTNERLAGITGKNPTVINRFYTWAYFHIRVTANTNLALTSLAIYGSAASAGSPPPGTVTEALCSTATNILSGNGLVRVPAMHSVDGDVTRLPMPIPQRLLVEYSTGAPGTTPVLTIEVRLVAYGLVPSAFEG